MCRYSCPLLRKSLIVLVCCCQASCVITQNSCCPGLLLCTVAEACYYPLLPRPVIHCSKDLLLTRSVVVQVCYCYCSFDAQACCCSCSVVTHVNRCLDLSSCAQFCCCVCYCPGSLQPYSYTAQIRCCALSKLRLEVLHKEISILKTSQQRNKRTKKRQTHRQTN